MVFYYRGVFPECGDHMGGVDPQCLHHLTDGMFPLYALVFLDCFCDRLCGAVVGHGIT